MGGTAPKNPYWLTATDHVMTFPATIFGIPWSHILHNCIWYSHGTNLVSLHCIFKKCSPPLYLVYRGSVIPSTLSCTPWYRVSSYIPGMQWCHVATHYIWHTVVPCFPPLSLKYRGTVFTTTYASRILIIN